jgi:hypothetical protein
MSPCVPACHLLFGRLSGNRSASSGKKSRIKVEAFSDGPSSRAFNKKIAQFSKLFLARSLFLFDGKSWVFNGSEIIKRRNFDKSAHSENLSRFPESID